jgi:hypothetical protein
LSENPISDKDDYREKLFDLFEDLEVLDNLNKDGDEVLSEDDDDDEPYGDDDEEGEMDEETRQKLIEQGYNFGDDDEEGEYIDDDDEEGEDFGDYGEDDDEEDESEDPQPANKRQKK